MWHLHHDDDDDDDDDDHQLHNEHNDMLIFFTNLQLHPTNYMTMQQMCSETLNGTPAAVTITILSLY